MAFDFTNYACSWELTILKEHRVFSQNDHSQWALWIHKNDRRSWLSQSSTTSLFFACERSNWSNKLMAFRFLPFHNQYICREKAMPLFSSPRQASCYARFGPDCRTLVVVTLSRTVSAVEVWRRHEKQLKASIMDVHNPCICNNRWWKHRGCQGRCYLQIVTVK